MIGRIVSQGRSGAGLHRYLSQDRRLDNGEQPTTSERVAWVQTLGSPSDDPELTIRIMQGVVADREILKRRNGSPAGGRKLKTGYVHGLVSFAPAERPSIGEQHEAVSSWLKAVDLDEHLAIAYAHNDGGARHIHLVVCKVHPYTGLAAGMSKSHQRLSTWARKWEEAHGGIRIKARARREAEREHFREAVDEELQHFEPAGRTKRERSAERARARKAAEARVRARGGHERTAIKSKRGAGRDDRTPEEKARWAALFADPSYKALSRRDQRAANLALKAELDAAREERAAAAEREEVPTDTASREWHVAEAVSRIASWSRRRGEPTKAEVEALTRSLRVSGTPADLFAADALTVWQRGRRGARRAEQQEGRWLEASAELIEQLRGIHEHFARGGPVAPAAHPSTPAAAGSGRERSADTTRGR